MSPRANQSTPRRVVLMGALAVAPLSACDVLSDDQGDGGPPAPSRDADRALVNETVEVEARLVELLAPLTRTGPPQQRRRARATLEVHRQHLALLESESPGGGGPGTGRGAASAARTVATAEDRAARRHRAAAGRAASGPFARVLAAMAAASAQQAQVWRS